MQITFRETLAVVASLMGTGIARAETTNPIFGRAAVQTTTPAENRDVVGKGAYADYYGYYGNYYSNLASQYGSYGYYYKNYSYYYSAYSYANSAATYYYDAYYYQYNGQ